MLPPLVLFSSTAFGAEAEAEAEALTPGKKAWLLERCDEAAAAGILPLALP